MTGKCLERGGLRGDTGGESVGACMHGLCSLCYGFWKHRKLIEVTRGRGEVWVHDQFCLLE